MLGDYLSETSLKVFYYLGYHPLQKCSFGITILKLVYIFLCILITTLVITNLVIEHDNFSIDDIGKCLESFASVTQVSNANLVSSI